MAGYAAAALLQSREVLEQSSTEVVTLFGMELHAVNVVAMHGATKVLPVVSDRCDVGLARAFEVERMQEVESRVALEGRKEPVTVDRAHVVPAHMRKPQVAAVVQCPQSPHAPFDPSEPGLHAFLARFSEHLHADANAKDGHTLVHHEIVQCLTHPRCVQT